MNELIQALPFLIVLVLMLAPFFSVISALFPKRVAKTQANIDALPGRSFTVGLVNFLFFFTIALVLFILADKMDGFLKALLAVPAVLLAALLAIHLGLGLAGVVNLLGERLFPAQPAWRRTLWGTCLLGIACGVPLVGWFLLLPYAGWLGMGALILGFFPPERPVPPKE